MKKRTFDLSESERSVTNRLTPILQNLTSYKSIHDLKKDFENIINDETTIISKEKIYEYKTNMKKYNNINMLGIYISNIILNGSCLGMDKLKK